MLTISPESETLIWQAAILIIMALSPPPPPGGGIQPTSPHRNTETPVGALTRRPHLALSSRLRAFVVHRQFRSSGSTVCLADRLLLILLGIAHRVVYEVSVSQQLARRDRQFLHAGKNPERASAAQAPAPLGAKLRTPFHVPANRFPAIFLAAGHNPAKTANVSEKVMCYN